MPNKEFFLYFENFEKGIIVLYVRDLPVGPAASSAATTSSSTATR